MKLTRRHFNKLAATGLVAAATPKLFAPALAQDKPLKIGIIAPRGCRIRRRCRRRPNGAQ